LVVTFHGYDFSTVPRVEGPDVYHNLFRDAGTVTVNCEYARERVRELGCPAERIQTLRMGVDLNEFAFQKHPRVVTDPVRVLTVARLVEKKGIEFAIRAIAHLREKHPGIRYDIIGDGPLRASLEKLVAELRLDEIVRFHGTASNQVVREKMKQAHIFLLSSVTAQNGDQEGTPVSLIEAQACGLPVISTRHSGIPEVVLDGESGFLVAERDAEALADKLSLLIENPRLCDQFGACGRKHVEAQFDVHRLNTELVRIYEQTVRNSAAQSE
jgi:colanic acid/amylovoran biosynthesis glycosyltransferase